VGVQQRMNVASDAELRGLPSRSNGTFDVGVVVVKQEYLGWPEPDL